MPIIPIELSAFHGGINLKTNPLLIKPEEGRIVKNVNLNEIGTLQKCKGYSIFGNQPTSDDVLSLYAFYKIGTTTERFLLRDSGGNVYKYDFTNNTWGTAIATGLSTTAIPCWETYKNLALRFNGVDKPKKYDGSTLTDLEGNPPNGSIVRLFKDRVYVAGVSPNYSTIYYSKVGNPEDWPPFNNFDVNANDGDRIIAMEPLFDSFLIFKEFSIWEYKVDRRNNPATLRYITLDIGTTSRRSVVNINGILYFFNRKGVYQFATRYPELISLKVEPFIKAVQNPYDVVAFQWDYKYCLFIGNVVVEGKTYNNCLLVYDTILDNWTVMTLANPVKTAVNFIGSDNLRRIYFGSTQGKTFLWESGYKFENTPIELEYETGLYQPGDPKKIKIFREVFVRAGSKPLSPVKIHYSIDGKDWRELGLVEETTQKFKFPFDYRVGTDIKLRFHEVSDKEAKPIYQVIIYVEEPEEAELPKKRK